MFTHLNFIIIILFISYSYSINICFDINDENSDLVTRNQFKAIFTSTASIRPFDDVNIKQVIENDVLLWEAEKEEQMCKYMVMFKFEEFVTMLCLKIVSPEEEYKRYLIKENGLWELLHEPDFNKIMGDMRDKIPGENQILLDIKNPDKQKINVSKRNTRGADFITFTTINPFQVIKIIEDKKLIWRGKNNEECCIDCAAYLRKDDIELIQAFLCSGNNAGFKFFKKEDDEWKILESDDFYKKLKDLDLEEEHRMNNECKKSSCQGTSL